jgi:peptidoglycan/LPS O-acetylase OafA/YrhL
LGTIRFLLAFIVVTNHVLWDEIPGLIMPGQVAVQVFFIISGFYMAFILKNKYARCPVSLFFTNRLLRLFPSYFFVLFISFISLQVFGEWIFVSRHEFNQTITSNFTVALSILWVNVTTLGQELGFLLGFDPSIHSFFWANSETLDTYRAFRFILIPPAWSISMEICFYFLAPFLFKRHIRWIVCFFLVSIIIRFYVLSCGEEYESLVRRFLPAELWLFLCGLFSYKIFSATKMRMKRTFLTGIGSCTMLVSAFALYNYMNAQYAIFVLACVATLTIPHIFAWSNTSKIDRLIGNLSYPIYLVHMMIIQYLDQYLIEYSLWMPFVATFVAAISLYYGIEMPIDRWRQRRLIKTVKTEGVRCGFFRRVWVGN